jgi:hypothetical protein
VLVLEDASMSGPAPAPSGPELEPPRVLEPKIEIEEPDQLPVVVAKRRLSPPVTIEIELPERAGHGDGPLLLDDGEEG